MTEAKSPVRTRQAVNIKISHHSCDGENARGVLRSDEVTQAIHCRLEFPMSQAWVLANGLLIGLGRKVFIVSTKGENQLKISPPGVLCFLSPRDNQGEILARV